MLKKHLPIYCQIPVLLVLISLFTAPAIATVPADAKVESQQLRLGFFPIVSTVALFKRFSPLRDYLSMTLRRPVVLQTAKDFPTFLQRTDAGQYDIVVTAPHFAVRAADSDKYVIRAALLGDVKQLFIVRKDSPLQSISELAGKRVATPPKSALMTIMGERYLNEAGLSGGKRPEYRAFTSHNASNRALLGGEVDVAVTSSNIYKKIVRRGEPLRILQEGKHLPNMALLVARDVDVQLGEKITQVLLGMQESSQGREVLKQISFPGYRAVSAKDYEPARSYMRQAITNMKKAGKLK